MDLTLIAWISLGLAFACALFILLDELRHPQAMAVMNAVWPLTALYFSIFALWAYFRLGRRHARGADGMQHGEPHGPPTAAQVALGTGHCGAGCALADVITEFALAAAAFTLFGSKLLTSFFFDFLGAWLLGIAFQYFAIRPMREDLSRAQALAAAIKADTLSIAAFQLGMYAFMALNYFVLFPAPHHLEPFDPRYWLCMQAAMICGFITSFPMNRWLIRRGIKEAM